MGTALKSECQSDGVLARGAGHEGRSMPANQHHSSSVSFTVMSIFNSTQMFTTHQPPEGPN